MLSGCSKKTTGPSDPNLSEEELAAVGRYDLTSITGIPGVDVDSFEYCYIELKSNGRFDYKIKFNFVNEISEQSGNWSLNGRVLTFTVRMGNQNISSEYSLVFNVITIHDPEDGITFRFTRTEHSNP